MTLLLPTPAEYYVWADERERNRLIEEADRQSVKRNRSTTFPTDVSLSALLYDRGGAVMNVMHPEFGVTGDGSTDDLTGLQAAIDATSAGDTVFFPAPTTSYLIDGQLILRNGRRYLFSSAFNTPVTIKLADGVNPAGGVLVSETWYDNASSSGNPIIIEGGLRIDGNKANNTSGSGIVLANFRSRLDRVQVRDCAETGILFTQTTRDTTSLTGTAVENVIQQCFVTDCEDYGIYVSDSTAFFTDGWINDCIVANTGAEDAIRVEHSTGWVIRGNHVWGTVPKRGLHIRNCDHTRITENYIERYGGSTATTGSYEGIAAHCFENVIVANNHIKNDNDVAGSTYNAIRVTTASSVTTRALVTSNQQEGNTTDEGILVVTTTGGGTMIAEVTGNQSYGVTAGVSFGSNATARFGHNDFGAYNRVAFSDSDATPSVRGGNMFYTANTGATTITDFDDGYEGQVIRVEVADGNTTIDFTASGLKGNAGADWSPANGDHMTCVYNGTDWLCDVSDNTA